MEEAQVEGIVASIMRPEYAPAPKPAPGLPINEAIAAAIEKNREGRGVTPLFTFARILKALPELERLDGLEAAKAIELWMPSISGNLDFWDEQFDGLCDDPRAEFIRSWEVVKVPGEGDSLTCARAAALASPLKPRRSYSKVYDEFISLAGHLQRAHPDIPVALPTLRIGAILGCDRKTVGLYRKFACKAGLLSKVGDYDVKEKLADEYIFDASSFDWITGEQVTSPSGFGYSEPTSSAPLNVDQFPNAKRPPSHVGPGASGLSLESEESVGSGGKSTKEATSVEGMPQGPMAPPPALSPGEPVPFDDQADVGSPFPKCPRCKGYALYRENNLGAYECETCKLVDIAESVARSKG